MSSQQPPPPQQPFGQQPPPGYYPPQEPPKKKHTLRNVLLVLVLLFVLLVGGCLALLGTAANEVDKAIEEDANKAGGTENALTITEGKAFEVDGFNYAASWSIKKDALGYIDVKGLKVTNNRDSQDSAIVEIKFMRGSEVVALSDCSTEPIAVGQTTTLDCISTDKLPKKYDKITINDSF